MVVVSCPDNSGLRVFKGQVFDLSLRLIALIQPLVVNKRAGEETKVKETVGAVMFTRLLSSASRGLLNPFPFWKLSSSACRQRSPVCRTNGRLKSL